MSESPPPHGKKPAAPLPKQPEAATPAKPKIINLALQGGGAHGAYTWGVLDRLLEDDRVEIEGVSGTSAGAMNAAVMVNGFLKDGKPGARLALADFWKKISDVGIWSPLHKSPFERFFTGWNMDYSPLYYAMDMMTRVFSPYELNPLNFNPLRTVLEETLDFDLIQKNSGIKLFVAATHVESGQARVFGAEEITAKVLEASACIPFMFQAVEIDGDAYWDGGYMGNPAIWPLIYHAHSEDIVLVQINPIHREGIPKRSLDIINRLNEISFNSSLIAEMRAIDFVKRLIDEGRVEHGRYKDVRMHLIYSSNELRDLNASSKVNASWDFFLYLHGIGRAAAQQWLEEHINDVGVKQTLNVREKFLCGPGKTRYDGEMAENGEYRLKRRRKIGKQQEQ